MAETTDQYRNRINQLKTSIENEPYMKNMRPDIAEGISKTGNRQADIEVRQIDLENDFAAVQQDASSTNPSGAEVAVARGGRATLDIRLDEIDVEMALLNQNKANQMFVDTMQTYLEDKISLLLDGSPRGVFETYEDLVAAYPTVTKGIFVVNADNNWYFWLVDFGWTSGGVYQKIQLTDNSVRSNQRTQNGAFTMIQTNTPLNINTTNKTLEFPDLATININIRKYNRNIASEYANTQLDISFGGLNGGWIYFDTATYKFVTTSSNSSEFITEDCVFIGVIFWSTEQFFLNSLFTVDGHQNFAKKSILSNMRTRIGESSYITSAGNLNINTITKELEFPVANTINVPYGNTFVNIATKFSGTTVDLSFGGASAGHVYFNPYTEEFNTDNTDDEDCYLMGSIWWDKLKFDLNFEHLVDGANKLNRLNGRYGASKTLAGIGDSLMLGITGNGDQVVKSCIDYLKDYLGFSQTFNHGVASSFVAKREGKTDSFVERVPNLPNADYLILFGGMNDTRGGTPLGTFEDGLDTTFYGAVEKVVSTWLTNNPKSMIFICTIPKHKKDANDSLTPNSIGLYQSKYNEVLLKVADKYSQPIVDLYGQLGISPFNPAQALYWMGDGQHYREGGYEKIAQFMSGVMKQHIV